MGLYPPAPYSPVLTALPHWPPGASGARCTRGRGTSHTCGGGGPICRLRTATATATVVATMPTATTQSTGTHVFDRSDERRRGTRGCTGPLRHGGRGGGTATAPPHVPTTTPTTTTEGAVARVLRPLEGLGPWAARPRPPPPSPQGPIR